MRLPIRETVMTVCGVAILAGLGTWQIQRMQWKNDIIAKLNSGYDSASKAAPLSEAALAQLSLEETPLGYGLVKGRLMREKAILLGPRTQEGRVGYHLLIPMELKDGHILILNAGWVNDMWKDDPAERLALLPMEETSVRGLIHKPDWSSFVSKNSPSNDMWFRADIAEITKVKELAAPYPFILYADSIDPPLHDVTPHEERWLPRNKHLQYALFWYALGISLAGVYGFYIHGLNHKND